MNHDPEIKQILGRQSDNDGPFWSREDGDIHAPNGSSTIDSLMVLGELGATPEAYPVLSKAIDFVFGYQAPDGSFRYSESSSKLPCITARILAALGRLGIARDERAEKGYRQLLEIQWNDGGWRCNTVRLGKSLLTDASNPGTTLYVLDAFRFRENSPKEMKQLEQGVDFLLQHWDVRQPIGPCNFGIGSRFMRIEYPFLRYNLFYYVYVLSFYKCALKDNRFQDAFNTLKKKTTENKIVPENPHRAWQSFDFARPGKVSEPATSRWHETKKNVEN